MSRDIPNADIPHPLATDGPEDSEPFDHNGLVTSPWVGLHHRTETPDNRSAASMRPLARSPNDGRCKDRPVEARARQGHPKQSHIMSDPTAWVAGTTAADKPLIQLDNDYCI